MWSRNDLLPTSAMSANVDSRRETEVAFVYLSKCREQELLESSSYSNLYKKPLEAFLAPLLFRTVIWNSHRSYCATETEFVHPMQWIIMIALSASY